MPPSMKNWSTAVTLSTCALILWVVTTRRPPTPVASVAAASVEPSAGGPYFQRGTDHQQGLIPQDDPRVAALAPGRLWIGISCSLPSEVLRSQLQLKPGTGLVVIDVVKQGPADRAGIQPHDVLLGRDASGTTTPFATPGELFAAVEAHGAEPLTLQYLRQARVASATISPEARPEDLTLAEPSTDAPAPSVAWTIPQIVLPRGVLLEFSRSSRGTTRIRVRRGEEFWDATAADVSALPADLRPVVRQLSLPLAMDQVVLADHPDAIPTPDVLLSASTDELTAGVGGARSKSSEIAGNYRRDLFKHYQEVQRLQNAQREAAERLEQNQDVIQRRLEDLKGTLEQLLEQPGPPPLKSR